MLSPDMCMPNNSGIGCEKCTRYRLGQILDPGEAVEEGRLPQLERALPAVPEDPDCICKTHRQTAEDPASSPVSL